MTRIVFLDVDANLVDYQGPDRVTDAVDADGLQNAFAELGLLG